jgi:PAS domain S-box-containing protein
VIGKKIQPELAEQLNSATSGLLPTTTLDNARVYTVFYRSSPTGWSAVIGVPMEQVDGPTRQLILFVVAGGLAVAALGAGVAFVIARRLRRLREAEVAVQQTLEKRVEERTEELRESEQRFRSVVDNSPNAVVLKDLEGRYRLVNRRYTEWFGLRPEEVYGKHTDDVHPKFYADKSDAEDREVLATGKNQVIERQLRFVDGTVHTVTATKFPVTGHGGRPIGVGLVAVDITLRKQAEAALRESEEKLRGAIANTGIGMMIRNQRDRTLVANDALCRMLGYTREEMVDIHFNDITHPDDREESRQLRKRMHAGEFDSLQSTKRLITKSGETIWVINNLSTIRGADGKPAFNINFYQDLTETKKTEEQLANALKLQALGQLTGGVAHEFNNLLLAITSSLGVLETKLEEEGREKDLGRFVKHALSAAFRGGGLTAQLVSYMGAARVSPKIVRVEEVITRSTDLLRPLLGEKIAVDLRVADHLWDVRVDEGQLHQALLNLALNARDAMPDGGKLIVEAANVRVDARYVGNRGYEVNFGDYVMIAVTDTGEGMSEEARERAFDPFFTTKEVGKGTGLGLSMVFGFVRRQSAGFLDIESELGRGTTVRIHLPRAKADAAPAAEKATAETPSPKTGRKLGTLLVLEDDALVLSGLKDALGQSGYTVLLASNGDEALDYHRSGRPIDLILADIMVPGKMNGIAVTQLIQKDRPETQVIYMTGHTDEGLMTAGLPKDAVVLRKPFKIAVFLEKARELRERVRH